jgi:hypothetical protein
VRNGPGEADGNASINEQRTADVNFRLRFDFKTRNRNFEQIRNNAQVSVEGENIRK